MNEKDELLQDALEEAGVLAFPRQLTLNEYQRMARGTAIYPFKGRNLQYPALGLAGEVGEICNKIKKIQRDDAGVLTAEKREAIIKECQDTLWYLSQLLTELGAEMGQVGADNIVNLRDRKKRGVLGGSGDNR
jgi:NTP pyrophosphatase (non-canonical NTP hydrolase)